MADQSNTKRKLDKLTLQEDKILRLLREERSRAQNKFPLAFALLATSGLVSMFSGLNKLIDKVEFFKENPVVLVISGLIILLLTGAAYKKLG